MSTLKNQIAFKAGFGVINGDNKPKHKPWAEWLVDTDLGAYYPLVYVYEGYAVKEKLKDLRFVWQPTHARWAWSETCYSQYEANVFIDAMVNKLREAGIEV